MTKNYYLLINNKRIHIGKKSIGWKFLWNWNNGKYYNSKKDMMEFIKSGSIIDDSENEYHPNDFLDMAKNWEKEGMDLESYWEINKPTCMPFSHEAKDHEYYIDDLRVYNGN